MGYLSVAAFVRDASVLVQEKSEEAILNQVGAWFAVMQSSSPSEDLTKQDAKKQ